MDRLYLKDPGGLLTPDAVRELAPHFVAAAAGDRTVELHSHCTIGLAPLVYVEGVRAGFQVVHTASGRCRAAPLSPRCASTVRNLEASGLRARVSTWRRRRRCPSTSTQLARRQGPPARRAARVRRGLLPPPAARRDGHDDAADARGAAPPRAVRRRARGGHARARRDGLPDPGHAGLAVRRQPGRAQRDRRRALGERLRRDDPLLPRPLRRAGGAGRPGGRRPRAVAPQAAKLRDARADHARRRARAVRPADLRGGAAAAPDDARGAGRRDDRGIARTSRSPRPPPARPQPARDRCCTN